MQSGNWYDAARVAQKGSVILARLAGTLARKNSQRRAERGVPPVLADSTYGPLPSSDSAVYEWLTGRTLPGDGLPAVSQRAALGVSAVYACVGLIGGAVASLPLAFYQRGDGGRRERVDVMLDNRAAKAHWLLNEEPAPKMAAAAFWEYIVASLLLQGDAMAWIYPSAVAPKWIKPLNPETVTVRRDPSNPSERVYDVWDDDLQRQFTVFGADMLHVPGIGFDGFRGLSVVRAAGRVPIGTAMAADEYHARFFANGARPDFVLETELKMDKAQIDNLRAQWGESHGGVGNSHRPAVLSGGLKAKPLALGGADIRIIESRSYGVADIARLFGVPPHMIGETARSTSWGSGIEQQSIGFVQYTLQRHLTKIEQEINRKLWPDKAPRSGTYFAEFVTDGLLRGDSAGRSGYYRQALGGGGGPGWMTPNEVRRLENLPPVDGGDKLIEWEKATAPQATTTEAETPKPPTEPESPEEDAGEGTEE